MILGDPGDWAELLDDLIPQILHVTIEAWESLPPIAMDEREDPITLKLCRAIRQARNARKLPLQIHTQQLDLDPAGEEAGVGRLDIVFNLLVPSEEIYFCLEGKRLNVLSNGISRAYAAEYIKYGVQRFVKGKYSKSVLHGAMIGYVLNGDLRRAMKNVENNLIAQSVPLCLLAPYSLVQSPLLPQDDRIRETRHQRHHDKTMFRLHHLFTAPVSLGGP